MRSALLVSSVVMMAGLSCGPTGPGDFPHAVATLMCGPADGPATGILLARDPIESLNPSHPYVQVTIWQAVGEIGGKTWWLDSGLGLMTARYWTGPSSGQDATDGFVRIERVGSDNRVEGRVALRFPDAQVSEEFSAPWVESFILCG